MSQSSKILSNFYFFGFELGLSAKLCTGTEWDPYCLDVWNWYRIYDTMDTYERAAQDQRSPGPPTSLWWNKPVWNASRSFWLKTLEFCHPLPPPSIVTHPGGPSNVHPMLSETSPPLGSIHRKPHMGGVRRQRPSLMPFWFSPLAFSWRGLVCVHVCHCMCVSVFFSEGLCAEEWGGGVRWQELWCRCPHSQRSLMNGNCCDGDGETRRRTFLRTPVIWMAGIQHGDKLMRANWKQCAPFITFSPSLSLSLSLIWTGTISPL